MCDWYKLILYIIIVFSNSVYALAAPFLPVVFAEKSMSGGWVGLIFAMYSISMIIVSPFIGVIVDKVGQTNLLALGLVAMGMSIILLGSMQEIENETAVIACSLFLRAVQGAASATINTSCYTLAANKYPNETEFMVGMLEGVSGIGLIAGFMGGSYLGNSLGFKTTYRVFGGLLPLIGLLTRVAFKFIEMGE